MLVPLVIVILIGAAVFSAVRNLNAPAQGTVVQNGTDAVSNTQTPGTQSYSDSQISFSYPGKFELGTSQKSGGVLDEVNLISSARRDEYVAIAVAKGSLATDPSVSYRRDHPELYKTNISSGSSVVFSKLDSTELTGFIQHGGDVASISLTSVTAQDLSPDYVVIADSLQWAR